MTWICLLQEPHRCEWKNFNYEWEWKCIEWDFNVENCKDLNNFHKTTELIHNISQLLVFTLKLLKLTSALILSNSFVWCFFEYFFIEKHHHYAHEHVSIIECKSFVIWYAALLHKWFFNWLTRDCLNFWLFNAWKIVAKKCNLWKSKNLCKFDTFWSRINFVKRHSMR